MSRKKTCLVVDDSAAIRRVITDMFRDLRFEVSEAPTGLHAVEICKIKAPDIVMLDWNMPVMDGITCLRELRAAELDRQPIIVMCTTESQISKIEQALQLGADEYIMKPFSRDVLLDKLAQFNLAASE